MWQPTSMLDGQPAGAQPWRGPRGWLVGALVVVLSTGGVVGLSALLGGDSKTAEAAASNGGGAGILAASDGPDAGAAQFGQRPANGGGAVNGGGTPTEGAGTGGTGSGGVPTPGGAGATTAAEPHTDAAKKTVKKATYHGIAGLGCAINGASYAEYGRYTNGDAGWWTLGAGSHNHDGCDGRFTDMPMSGSESDTAGQAIMWAFQVGSASQSCALSLYVPNSSSSRDVAARSAHFAVVHGTQTGNTTYASPSGDRIVNQSAHHSSWVSLGTYPVHNGQIGVKLTNRGSTAGYAMTYPHLAGGAVRISCTQE
jgi:hypothetical protein